MRTPLLLLLLSFSWSAMALNVSVNVVHATCGFPNGRINSYASGGVFPYTFTWTGPNGFSSSSQDLVDLEAGIYDLTVTDGELTQAMQQVQVYDLTELPDGDGGAYGIPSELTGQWGGACPWTCNGTMAMSDEVLGGTPPFTYEFSVPATFIGTAQGYPVYSGFCLDDFVTYTYTDANGCVGQGSFVVWGIQPSDYPGQMDIQGSCLGETIGSIGFMTTNTLQAEYTLSLNGEVLETIDFVLGGYVEFTDLAPGDYVVTTSFYAGACPLPLDVTVPDLDVGCGRYSGSSWYDVNGDCTRDASEVGIPNSVLAIEPGGYFALTHLDGGLYLDLPNGNYTLTQTDPSLVPICPVTQPVPFTVDGSPLNIELANGSTAELDLRALLSSSAARPGFDHSIHTSVRNLSPQLSGPVTAVLAFDPMMTYLDATPPPTSVSGNVLTWELDPFTSFQETTAHVHFNFPTGTAIGTELSSTYSVSNTLPDADGTNNSATTYRIVTGAYDPNDKIATTSSRESDVLYIIDSDDHIDYTIRFQNTGTDTAFTVVITDTLSAEYDMSSFQPGVCSHPCTVDFRAGRVVEWTFSNILLPDSNVNEAASHGLTSFRIKLNEPVLPGTLIENIANIYFDFNEPVITEPSVLVAEFSTAVTGLVLPRLDVSPNPATELMFLRGIGKEALANLHVLSIDGRSIQAPMRWSGS
ncbi:MAG: hypothetical protein KDC00_10020, partial [Flavobacteriales bacterium]|nr:hypothetical protein [Flavobacteriales bacterium]